MWWEDAGPYKSQISGTGTSILLEWRFVRSRQRAPAPVLQLTAILIETYVPRCAAARVDLPFSTLLICLLCNCQLAYVNYPSGRHLTAVTYRQVGGGGHGAMAHP